MISKLQRFFNTYLDPRDGATGADTVQRTRLAVAALMVEITLSDFESVTAEQRTIIEIVKTDFALTEQEADALISLAEAEHQSSTDYFQFTRLINQHYTPEQKVELLESLWRVAYADGQLHKYEEHVIRRLSDLLHVSHRDFIATKHRAKKSSGVD